MAIQNFFFFVCGGAMLLGTAASLPGQGPGVPVLPTVPLDYVDYAVTSLPRYFSNGPLAAANIRPTTILSPMKGRRWDVHSFTTNAYRTTTEQVALRAIVKKTDLATLNSLARALRGGGPEDIRPDSPMPHITSLDGFSGTNERPPWRSRS